MQLNEKTILITGSTDGVGQYLANILAAQGAMVLIHGRHLERGERLVKQITSYGGRAYFYPADFSSLSQVRNLADAVNRDHPSLDILINNAGIGTGGRRASRELSKDGSPMIMNSHKQLSDKPDNNAILMAVAEAHIWKERLIKEQITVKQLAQNLSMNTNFIYKRLKLLSLSSTILKQITSNSLSPLISIKDLYQACESLCWQKQHQFLSF